MKMHFLSTNLTVIKWLSVYAACFLDFRGCVPVKMTPERKLGWLELKIDINNKYWQLKAKNM